MLTCVKLKRDSLYNIDKSMYKVCERSTFSSLFLTPISRHKFFFSGWLARLQMDWPSFSGSICQKNKIIKLSLAIHNAQAGSRPSLDQCRFHSRGSRTLRMQCPNSTYREANTDCPSLDRIHSMSSFLRQASSQPPKW